MPDDTNNLTPTNKPVPPPRKPVAPKASQAQAAQAARQRAKAGKKATDYHEPAIMLKDIADVLAKAQQNAATNPPPPAATNDPGTNAPSTNVPETNAPGTNAPATNQIIVPPPGTGIEVILPPPPQVNAPPEIVISVAPAAAPGAGDSTAPPQIPVPGNGGSGPPPADEEHVTFPWIGGPPGASTDQMQANAEQIRRAFELNTQGQLSLYERMIELLDAQNQKLGELDRRTSELTNQIKSLKNP